MLYAVYKAKVIILQLIRVQISVSEFSVQHCIPKFPYSSNLCYLIFVYILGIPKSLLMLTDISRPYTPNRGNHSKQKRKMGLILLLFICFEVQKNSSIKKTINENKNENATLEFSLIKARTVCMIIYSLWFKSMRDGLFRCSLKFNRGSLHLFSL